MCRLPCHLLLQILFPWLVRNTVSFQAPQKISLQGYYTVQSIQDSNTRRFALLPSESNKKLKSRKENMKGANKQSRIEIANQIQFVKQNSTTNQLDDTNHGSLNAEISLGRSLQLKNYPDLAIQLQYARNGHAAIRQILPPDYLQQLRKVLVKYGQEKELAAWRQKVYVAADRDPVRAKQIVESSCHTIKDCQKQLRLLLRTDDVSLPFLQYFNTWRTHPAVYDIASSLAEVAAILMDVPSVRLYQDAIFWKRIGDGPTPWHTDARMAPFDTSHIVTIWIPLQPVYKSGLIFCSKSHNDFALPYWNDITSSESDPSSPWNHLEKRYKSSSSLCDYMPLALGDITVHSGWTMHCADAYEVHSRDSSIKKQDTATTLDRMALAITYVDAYAPVRDPKSTSNKCDREDMWSYQDWIHDVPYNVSRKWNHPLVPIVWPTQSSQRTTRRMKRKL